ncbi:MAG: GGDEF domain-containing protein [Clostridia bacterium]
MKKLLTRLDIQVIMITGIFVLVTSIIVTSIYWNAMFDIVLDVYRDRALAIYNTTESKIDPKMFIDINSPEDMETDLYKESLDLLLLLKNNAGVLYLYTAKLNTEGELVYVIDGLEQDQDFRYPNDIIEESISQEMLEALNGEAVMPSEIKETYWGDILVAYVPFQGKNDEVLGVVGIEFDVAEISKAYTNLKIAQACIVIIVTVIAVIISKNMFKRISNPLYIDKNTEDALTGLKNRNAYEVDINNIIARGHSKGTGIIVADINGLKNVNDRLGHSAGDEYIKIVSNAIKSTKSSHMVAYRTGGDEFVIMMHDATEKALEKFINDCTIKVKEQKEFEDMRCSLACGYGICDLESDYSLEETYHKADVLMYQEKRRQKENNIR